MNSEEHSPRETLNSFQANRLRITCQYIDKLLAEIEEILGATNSKAAFPRYVSDILPAQRRTIEDYIARVRAQLVRIVEGQGIARENPSVPASRAVHVSLGAIDIAAEELRPRYMRGYGAIPEAVSTELNGIVGELSSLIHRFDRYLLEGLGEDLKSRLDRLEKSDNDLALLKQIEQVVRDRGLVEFRPSIAAILDRAEDKSFEIAVFGRVSSGKSSLLNAILETDVLPVGVTPITTIPTRITYAEEPSLSVSFSEAPRKKLDVTQLQEFATEQQNPGNAKHVARLVLSLPSPRLRGGVTFVDTPGLGSLATSGAAETLAYLPKCDLGVFLIDAGSTLTADDLRTILTLQEAAIPINVLLSKADLIGPEDRARIVRYVKEHISSECKQELAVHPVSVVASSRNMLDEWFEGAIIPLYARSQELRAASLRRKIGSLRDSVAASLEARLKHDAQSSTRAKEKARGAEERLRKATGKIEESRSVCARFVEAQGEQARQRNAEEAVAGASKRLLQSWANGESAKAELGAFARDSIAHFVQAETAKLQSEISALASHLGADLQECAADLGVSEVPSEGEFESIIRGAPVFECPAFKLNISRPTFVSRFGMRIALRSLTRQISRQLQPTFYTALETYWRLVGEWSSSVIAQLKHRFENYAESYRARAEMALGGRELTSSELVDLQESLARLNPDLPGENGRKFDSARDHRTPREEHV